MSKGNLHESFTGHAPIKTSSERSFGMVFAAVFAIVGLLPVVHGGAARIWSLAVAVAFLLLAFVAPGVLAPLNRVWAKVGLLLHRIMNPVVMGLIFFLTVTPTALVLRAMGKDPLRLRFDKAAKTYWIDRTPPGPAPETMKQPF